MDGKARRDEHPTHRKTKSKSTERPQVSPHTHREAAQRSLADALRLKVFHPPFARFLAGVGRPGAQWRAGGSTQTQRRKFIITLDRKRAGSRFFCSDLDFDSKSPKQREGEGNFPHPLPLYPKPQLISQIKTPTYFSVCLHPASYPSLSSLSPHKKSGISEISQNTSQTFLIQMDPSPSLYLRAARREDAKAILGELSNSCSKGRQNSSTAETLIDAY